jgi:WD40 repeat protein
VRVAAKLPRAGVSAVRVRPDARISVSCGWDGKVRVFDWARFPAPLAVLGGHVGAVHAFAFAPEGTARVTGVGGVLASAGKDSRIVVHSLYAV